MPELGLPCSFDGSSTSQESGCHRSIYNHLQPWSVAAVFIDVHVASSHRSGHSTCERGPSRELRSNQVNHDRHGKRRTSAGKTANRSRGQANARYWLRTLQVKLG
jgi:hypothetical protein